MGHKRGGTDHEQVEATVRANLLADAHFVLSYQHISPSLAARRDQVLGALSPEDRQWVIDLEAGRIREHGCLAEIVERRTGATLSARSPAPAPDHRVVDLRDHRRRRSDRPAPPTG